MDIKCFYCNKKTILLNNCKCNKKFCFKHILPEIHNCECIDKFKKEAFESNKKKLLSNAVSSKQIDFL